MNREQRRTPAMIRKHPHITIVHEDWVEFEEVLDPDSRRSAHGELDDLTVKVGRWGEILGSRQRHGETPWIRAMVGSGTVGRVVAVVKAWGVLSDRMRREGEISRDLGHSRRIAERHRGSASATTSCTDVPRTRLRESVGDLAKESRARRAADSLDRAYHGVGCRYGRRWRTID